MDYNNTGGASVASSGTPAKSGFPFDFASAREAGYSDDEIVDHLAANPVSSFDFKAALQAGYSPSEIVAHLSGGELASPRSAGYLDAAREGLTGVLSGSGETLNDYVAGGLGDKLIAASKTVAPENYAPAKVIGDGGSLSELPRAAVEAAPGMITSIAVAKAMPGPAWLKLLAGSAAYYLQTVGNRAKQRAINNTGDLNAVPTAGDKIAAAVSEVPEAAIGTLGLSRFLPGAGRIANVGAEGVLDAAKQLGKTALIEGATSGAQNTAAQLGATVGTNTGVHIDPTQAANAALVGGFTGGALGTPKAIGESLNALKYRGFGGDMANAATSVANDVANKAGGAETLQPTLLNSKGSAAFDAVSRADNENQIALANAVKSLKATTTLPPDAQNALALATKGAPLNDGDLQAIDKAVEGNQNGETVSFLARKASVFSALKGLGHYDQEAASFTGGSSNKLLGLVRHNALKTVLAGIVGEGAGIHMLAYSPYALAAAGAGGLAARIADRALGNLSPAARFVSQFADPAATPTNQQPAPPLTPTRDNALGPWGPFGPQPSVPSVAQIASEPIRVRGFAGILSTHVRQINRADKIRNQATVAAAMPLVRELAAQQAPVRAADIVTPSPSENASAPPAAVPKDVMAQTRSLVRGLALANKLKQNTLGSNQAEQVATNSPLIASVGGLPAVANTAAGQRMNQMVNAAKALKMLTATQDHGGEVPETAPPATGTANDEYQIPSSPYAHLPADQAASAIAKDAERAGNVRYMPGFRAATMRNLTTIRDLAASVAKDAPNVSAASLAAQFEGVASQADAITHRDWLASKLGGSAATALNKYFSNEQIERIWKRK